MMSLQSIVLQGLDEFEEKIEELGKNDNSNYLENIENMGDSEDVTEKKKEGDHQDNEGWFSKIVKEFFKVKQEVEKDEIEELEEREEFLKQKSSEGSNSTIVENEEELDAWLESNSIKKRS